MNYNKALDNGSGGPDEISDQQIKGLVQKFQRKGFDGLALEEVATALIIPNFGKVFQQHTGLDWQGKFEVKALERLNRSKFDIQWMARKDNSEHSGLFINCQRGDLVKVKQYLKESKDPQIKSCVDSSKKNPLHVATIEGHLSIVEILLLSGFNPNCRDRTLKTPLHYGSLHGHETIVDTLLKAGSDIVARDSLGRSCIHFAASCPSQQTLQLILATKPELANDVDQRRRTPLHYCVWNSSQHQVSLLRTLLDFKANPMALDEDLKTPIHHAAEGGKTRAIPVLLQRGGQESMQLRDRSQKTPLELAANDRTREVLIVYSSSPLNTQQQDLKYLDQAVQGQKLGSQQKSQQQQQQPIMKPQQSPQFPIVEKEIVSADPPPLQVKWAPSSINAWIREKFFTIMKKVQESGIKANHHLKKPYIYTGSWMEGINTMEELYGAVKDIPAGEACVRAFNILCPFDRVLPNGNGIEDVVDGFYGELWFDGSSAVTRVEQMEEMRRKMQQEYLARITDLETELQIKSKHLFETDQDLAQTRAQLEVSQRQNKSAVEKLQSSIDTLNKQMKAKEDVIAKLDKDKQQLTQKIKNLELENEEIRNQPQGISEEEVQEYMTQISDLKEQLQAQKDQEKTLRSKAGQLFLKSISSIKNANEEKLSQLKNQTLAQIQLEKEKMQLEKERMQQDKLNANKLFDQERNKLLEEKNMLLKEKQKIQAEVLESNAVGGVDNLQDDDAIIVLLKALKGNPPPMKQRMKTFDGDLDGSLTQDEFRQFLASLKLSQQDIHSLCRIGGFLGQKKIIGIEEWAQILQDRPKQREQFEQALFCKLLDAIKARNLTVEKMFELIDTDGSGSLSPAELKQGLKSLKIILNQKDLNNMFAIFDSDKSGSVSLEEMRDTLNNYQKLREEQGIGEIVDENERMQVEDGDNPYEEVETNDTELKQELKEWNIDIKDFTKINGSLKVQLIRGSAINSKSLCCHFSLKGGGELEKQVILFDQSEFKQAFFLPINSALKENLSEYVQISLYKNTREEENFVGDVKIMWKQILSTPNQWAINNRFQLQNTIYIKEESKMYKPDGFVNVAIKFIPGEQIIDTKTPVVGNKMVATIVEDGVLEIMVVQCILKQELKQLKEPKFFAQIKFMSIDKKIQAQLTASNDLYWENKFLQDLKCIANEPIDTIYVKVYVETPKNLIQTNTQIIGEFYINWSECLTNPGQYLSQKSYQLMENTKVYLKIRYVPQSMFQQIVGFKEGASKEEKKKQLTLEDMIEGTLKILFVRGKNLRADDGDTSDPYCIAKVKSFDKEIKIQSKTIKCTLNPEWRDLQQIKVLMPKEAPYPPLELQLFDEDVLGDDELGTCKVDLAPCVEQPCKWSINEYFDVIDAKAKQPGQIYIQCYWVPKGMKDPNLKAKDKFDASGCADPDPNFIDGELIIKVVHARELKADSPDPYVIINFPGGKELKTETISSSNNPVFNQILRQQFKVKKEVGAIPLKVLVKDSNILSDDLIGYVDMQWEECVAHPGEWAINQVYNLNAAASSKNFGSIGFLYMQVKFIERGMIDDQAEAPLTENLFEIINSKQGIYQGSLRIFLVHARGLVIADSKASDPYIVFKVPGGKKVETQQKPDTINPSWKTIYNINVSMPKDTIQPLRLEIFDNDLVNDELMGYCTINLLDVFNNPQIWKFNEVVDLQGDVKMQQKFKTKVFGKVYLQIMYCLQGIQNNDPPLPLTEDLDFILREQQQENKKPMKGRLHINIPVALGLRPDDGVTADPYCKLTFPDGHTVKSKQIDKTINPIFNFMYQWNCNLIKEQYKPIFVQIFDSDTVSDDLLGELQLEWMDCFLNPTQWMINKQFQLTEGKVYIQSKFLLPGQETTPEGIRACDTVQELYNDYGRVLGKIDVKIISASQLYNADITGKSDTFVECNLSSETKKMQTPVKDNTLDPVWDFEGSLVIELLRCQVKMNTINFSVNDDDEIGKDFLGQCEVDLIDILEKNPGSVMLQDLPLKDPSKKGNPNLGSLKVQFVWIPDPYNEGVVGLRQPPKMFEGELCIRFPNARQLPKGDPYVKFLLTEDMEKIYKCKHLESNQNPDWNYEEIIKLSISERQILTQRIKATIMNYNSAWKDTIFGGITVLLTDLFRKPGMWINQYYQLFDDDGKQIESYVHFQSQFRLPETQDKNPPPLIDFKTFINQGKPPTFSGKIKFTYIGLKNLENMDITGLSDPFVEIKLSKGATQAFKTTTQDDKLDCFWKDPGEYVFKDIQQEDLQLLRFYIMVYDYDYNSNDVLGKCEMDLSNLKSGQWVNYRIPLLSEKDFPQKSEIYIQALFTLDGDTNIQQQPNNLYEDIARQQQQEQERIKKEKEDLAAVPRFPGSLRVFAPFAKSLLKADIMGDSDPYVEFKISKGSKQVLKSNTIDNDPNPVWNYAGEFALDMQQQEYKDIALMCTVYDYDTIVSCDFLGYIELGLTDIFNKPGTWINGIFQLKDEHGTEGKNGLIYLQVQWVPTSLKSSISPAQPPQQQQQQQPQQPIKKEIKGVLYVAVLKIIGYDKKSQIKVTQGGKSQNSNLVQPGVDYNLKCQFDLPDPQINICLLDEKQQQIADANIDTQSIINEPGKWINSFYKFQHSNIQPNLQQFYLQCQWRPSDVQINTSDPPLISDPQIQLPVVQAAPPVIQRGKLKIAVIKAEKIKLMDNNKTSNTKVTVIFNGDDYSTSCVKGAAPEWKKILDPFKFDSLKPLQVNLFHDPGVFSKCIPIGEVTIADLTPIFSAPNTWAIKNDFIIQGNGTGIITLWIGFIGEKDKDNLTKIQ